METQLSRRRFASLDMHTHTKHTDTHTRVRTYAPGFVRSLASKEMWVAAGSHTGTINVLDLRIGELLHMWKPYELAVAPSVRLPPLPSPPSLPPLPSLPPSLPSLPSLTFIPYSFFGLHVPSGFCNVLRSVTFCLSFHLRARTWSSVYFSFLPSLILPSSPPFP